MADPKLKPTGMEQGDLCQLLYELVSIMISGTACTVANFTISVYDRTMTNRTGPTALTQPLYTKGAGIDQGYLADLLYEIAYGVITTLTHAAATYFTTGVFNQAGSSAGTFSSNRVIRPNGINMGHLAQFLYEVINTLIDQEAGVSATDFTVDVEDLAGNITGKND